MECSRGGREPSDYPPGTITIRRWSATSASERSSLRKRIQEERAGRSYRVRICGDRARRRGTIWMRKHCGRRVASFGIGRWIASLDHREDDGRYGSQRDGHRGVRRAGDRFLIPVPREPWRLRRRGSRPVLRILPMTQSARQGRARDRDGRAGDCTIRCDIRRETRPPRVRPPPGDRDWGLAPRREGRHPGADQATGAATSSARRRARPAGSPSYSTRP